jgi:hypothetical protein
LNGLIVLLYAVFSGGISGGSQENNTDNQTDWTAANQKTHKTSPVTLASVTAVDISGHCRNLKNTKQTRKTVSSNDPETAVRMRKEGNRPPLLYPVVVPLHSFSVHVLSLV